MNYVSFAVICNLIARYLENSTKISASEISKETFTNVGMQRVSVDKSIKVENATLYTLFSRRHTLRMSTSVLLLFLDKCFLDTNSSLVMLKECQFLKKISLSR